MEIFGFLQLVGAGIVLGIATVVPGFSAGTMAVALNVYDRLINVIVPNVKKILSSWKFWLPLVIGCITGIIIFSKVITMLLENYYIQAYWFFIGVIIGTIPLIYRKVRPQVSAIPSLPVIICAVLGFAVMIVMAFTKPQETSKVYTELNAHVFILLTLGGALAAIAMIIPGISGTFLLLIIGLYHTIVQAVSDFNMMLLIPVVIGTGAGLLLGAASVRFLLKHVPRQTYGAVLGLITGSVFVLYPGGFGSGKEIAASVLCFLCGCVLSFFMGKQK